GFDPGKIRGQARDGILPERCRVILGDKVEIALAGGEQGRARGGVHVARGHAIFCEQVRGTASDYGEYATSEEPAFRKLACTEALHSAPTRNCTLQRKFQGAQNIAHPTACPA